MEEPFIITSYRSVQANKMSTRNSDIAFSFHSFQNNDFTFPKSQLKVELIGKVNQHNDPNCYELDTVSYEHGLEIVCLLTIASKI